MADTRHLSFGQVSKAIEMTLSYLKSYENLVAFRLMCELPTCGPFGLDEEKL